MRGLDRTGKFPWSPQNREHQPAARMSSESMNVGIGDAAKSLAHARGSETSHDRKGVASRKRTSSRRSTGSAAPGYGMFSLPLGPLVYTRGSGAGARARAGARAKADTRRPTGQPRNLLAMLEGNY